MLRDAASRTADGFPPPPPHPAAGAAAEDAERLAPSAVRSQWHKTLSARDKAHLSDVQAESAAGRSEASHRAAILAQRRETLRVRLLAATTPPPPPPPPLPPPLTSSSTPDPQPR